MDAMKAILTKRDTRAYTGDAVDQELLDRVLQAARMAGSAKNSQVSRVIVVTDPDDRQRLAACGDFTGWIGSAPVVLVFVMPTDTGRLFDLGRMAQNVMVAAHALGLATCPVTFHHQDRIREVTGIPETHEGPMGVTLGHPPPGAPAQAAPGLRAPRIPLDELVHWGRW